MNPEEYAKLVEATEFAFRWHAGQRRKASDIPYISHPLQVEGLILEHGGNVDQAVSGLLHDVLEDAPDSEERARREEIIRDRFGPVVLEMILACTDTLPVESIDDKGDRVVGHILDQAQLVLLTTGLEHLDDLVTRGHFLDHVVIGGDQLSHALFDGSHVVRREGALVGDVVIKAIINHRADNHLGGGIQLLDGVTDQVSTGVADNLNAFFVFGGDDLQACVLLDQVTGINQAAIYFAGDRSLGQTSTNRLGDFRNGNGIIEIALTAVREGNNGHVPLLLSGDPYARPHDGNAARMPRCSSYRCHDYRQPSSGYCNSTPHSTETKNPATGTGF